ncbi:MAG: ADP-ribosylglycohydrolase family protein [Marmoricola sp.]
MRGFLAHLDDPQALVEAAHQVAALTHYDPLGADACALWCLAIRHAVLLGELPVLVDLVDFLHPDRRDFWRTTVLKAESDQPQTFRPNGYVVTALQAAWSAISHTPIPLHDPAAGSVSCQHLVAGLNAAIAIGDDTDTVASIAGALLGARWGYSSIPWQWRRILHGWPGVRNKDLHDVAVLTIQGASLMRKGGRQLAASTTPRIRDTTRSRRTRMTLMSTFPAQRPSMPCRARSLRWCRLPGWAHTRFRLTSSRSTSDSSTPQRPTTPTSTSLSTRGRRR